MHGHRRLEEKRIRIGILTVLMLDVVQTGYTPYTRVTANY